MSFSLRGFARGFSKSMAESGRLQQKESILKEREKRLAKRQDEVREDEQAARAEEGRLSREFQASENEKNRSIQEQRLSAEEARLALAEERADLEAKLRESQMSNDTARTGAAVKASNLQAEVAQLDLDDKKAARELMERIADTDDPEIKKSLTNQYLLKIGKNPYDAEYKIVRGSMGEQGVAILRNGELEGSVSMDSEGNVRQTQAADNSLLDTLQTEKEIREAVRAGKVDIDPAMMKMQELRNARKAGPDVSSRMTPRSMMTSGAVG